ncbi:hypothetical protein A176_000680 [Myxococcus hansupus]|uniref:Uncharacterized protein n=1 Tax=Pseudomyxococcus hansupus TaxID=1297742 RepID=A0A0H4WQ94_9BACT|nr:hypothetical protein A176_000680 [Myxococcus hansupus]
MARAVYRGLRRAGQGRGPCLHGASCTESGSGLTACLMIR